MSCEEAWSMFLHNGFKQGDDVIQFSFQIAKAGDRVENGFEGKEISQKAVAV